MAGEQSRETLRGLFKISCINTFLQVYTCIYFKATLTLLGNFLHMIDSTISEVTYFTYPRGEVRSSAILLFQIYAAILKIVLGAGGTENSKYCGIRIVVTCLADWATVFIIFVSAVFT
jgi:hypothetical protein